MHPEDKSKTLQRQIVHIHLLLSVPASLMIGAAVYGLAMKGDAYPAFMNNTDVTYSLLVVGGFTEVLALVRLFPLFQQQAALQRDSDTEA